MPPKTKPSPQRLVVKLKVPIEILTRFSSEPPVDAASLVKTKSSPSSTPVPPANSSSTPDDASEAHSTPAPPSTSNDSAAPGAANPLKRKGVPGPKPGAKRGPALGPDGLPKPRGKPGPKKKPRLEDGTIDHGEAGPPVRTVAAVPGAAHKLGPKANQGAINAGLRALDRSGNPCKRWEKKGFQVKSFTGIVWQVPTWRTPKPALDSSISGSQGDSNASLGNADSESKENKESSEPSNADAEALPSSPAMAATPA
ncbi:MAG: hypothetical protein M1814_005450 [Vezdaea aestivalis]|nr:MAG: hypothetical protein M1814_005450 [Vezdaea aestivalis]